MRALVVGGSGQIGGWLLRVLAGRGHEGIGTFHSVAYPGLVALDAADSEAVDRLLDDVRPEAVFYPAGYTYVDGCERDPGRAMAANRDQPCRVALAAARRGARFVYFSTDYVFDGASGPYDEDAPARPICAYGRSKLEAERALGEAALVVRTSWVFGPERQGKNFAYQVARALRAGKAVTCPVEMASSPSYAPDVARAVVGLVESGRSGLFHVAGPEVVGRVGFARAIAEAFHLDPSGIVGRPNAERPQGAPRPLRGGLVSTRLGPDAMRRTLAECARDLVARLDAGEGWADPRTDP